MLCFKDQLAILVDGTVVPCCLDSEAVIKLGNIYEDRLEDILNSKRFQEMRKGFCNRKVTEELCKHCSFKERLLINQVVNNDENSLSKKHSNLL